MSPQEIRLGTPDDAATAGAMLEAFQREFDSPVTAADVVAGRLRTLLASDDAVLVLAGPREAPTGLALLILRPTSFADGPAALLEELYVVPGRRGEGIGSAILTRSVDEARARDAGVFEVPVDEGDVDARRFYERHGFSNLVSPGDDERMLFYEQELT